MLFIYWGPELADDSNPSLYLLSTPLLACTVDGALSCFPGFSLPWTVVCELTPHPIDNLTELLNCRVGPGNSGDTGYDITCTRTASYLVPDVTCVGPVITTKCFWANIGGGPLRYRCSDDEGSSAECVVETPTIYDTGFRRRFVCQSTLGEFICNYDIPGTRYGCYVP